ncbi:SRPBCC family protein [Hymenobacter koreensis]|uniref:SRPBCC family protein n=1 Tax=Hymenobacter koreensis TaxID=1084523 RepID=A0ABP8JH22_9BACT
MIHWRLNQRSVNQMKTLKKIGLGLLGLVVVLAVVGMLLPRHVHVERSLTMQAPPAVVFEQVNTLQNWEAWSPWHKLDPNMQLTYAGPAAGAGASYSWLSQMSEVGNGTLRILHAIPHSRIDTEMVFDDNGKGQASYFFTSTPQGTKVTWTMDTDLGLNPVGRYVGLFIEGWVGQDYERGLRNLQQVVEGNSEAKQLTANSQQKASATN